MQNVMFPRSIGDRREGKGKMRRATMNVEKPSVSPVLFDAPKAQKLGISGTHYLMSGGRY
jgi:hypothetical protein